VTSQLISATYLFVDTPLSSILGSPHGRATTMYGAFFCAEKKLIKQKQVYNQWLLPWQSLEEIPRSTHVFYPEP
jgi:hypothetical protein